MHKIIETKRLYLRQFTQDDFTALCRTLQDDAAMYAYNGALNDDEVQAWLDRQLSRYAKYGFGSWALVLKDSDEIAGQCGLSMQPWIDGELLEVGYLLEREHWHKGYATEAAQACIEYAFDKLGADEVCAMIRNINKPSQQVAMRCGMKKCDSMTKHYRGVDMPHDRYVIKRGEWYGY